MELNLEITRIAAKLNPLTAIGNRTSVFFENKSAVRARNEKRNLGGRAEIS